MEQPKKTHFDQLWARYDHFIFDCDGVLVQGKKAIGNALKVLSYLQNILHKSIYILSNYGCANVDDLLPIFASEPSLKLDAKHVYFSSYLAGKYISTRYPSAKNVYYLGNAALRKELEKFDFHAIGEEDDKAIVNDYIPLIKRAEERKIDAVVVSHDNKFNTYKLFVCCVAIANGAKLISTNRDVGYLTHGKYLPDTGTILSAVEVSTGKQAEVVGKPEAFGFDTICSEHGIADRSRVLMIGDTLATDIAGGQRAGMDTCLVSSDGKDCVFDTVTPSYIIPAVDALSPGCGLFLT